MPLKVTRRNFLKSTASVAGLPLLASWPQLLAAAQEAAAASAAAAEFETLAPDDAADLAAIAAQIIPTDQLPGATEAGVVYFMDKALGSFMSARAPELRAGLASLNKKAAQLVAGARFAGLAAEQQMQLLKKEEKSAFFDTVRYLTIAGMFALPSYGGNRDQLGWKLIGMEHRHGWAPPFGHYDTAPVKPGSKA